MDSLARVGEGKHWFRTPFEWENWGQIPLEREKLLRMAQRAINRGKSKVLIQSIRLFQI